MTKTITNITATYSDGTQEQFTKSFTSILSSNMEYHDTLEGFIKELFHDWDKTYALEQLDSDWQQRLKDQLEASGNSQRAIIKGQQVQKFFPLLQFNYDIGDMIPIFNVMDFITLVGLDNDTIKELVIQEVKTGQAQITHKQRILRDFIKGLSHPQIKFELWRQQNLDEPFKLIEHNKHKE